MRVRCRTSRMALPIASRYSSADRSSSSATSSEPRSTVSGVRSSWETSAMNCCCSFSAEASESSLAFSTVRDRVALPRRGLPSGSGRAVASRSPPAAARAPPGARAPASGAERSPRRRACRRARPRTYPRCRFGLADAIADAADRLDQLLALAAVDLLAQRVDVHVDDVGREVEGVFPDARLDLGARNDLAAPAQQQLEERALANGQLDGLAAAGDLARLRLVGQVLEDERSRRHDLGPPQQRAHARHELPEREGLDEIVVGPGVEALDLVLDRVARREHEDLGAHAAGPQLPAELQAVPRAVEHQVEDDEIRALRRRSSPGRRRRRRRPRRCNPSRSAPCAGTGRCAARPRRPRPSRRVLLAFDPAGRRSRPRRAS